LLSNTYVLGSDHKLWWEIPNSQHRIFMDSNVLAFAQSDAGVFVEGTDHKLWLEFPFWQLTRRVFMDANVLSFAPAGNGKVFVEGYDSKLSLEVPGWQLKGVRPLVDSNVYAFSAAGNGNVYVEGYDGKLWLEHPNYLNRSLIDANVYAFSAAGNGNVYVEGYDGKLWLEHPNYLNRSLIDSKVLAFAPAGNGDILVEGTDQKLWLEAPAKSPTLIDSSVLSFAPAGNGDFLVLGTDGILWLEAPGVNPIFLDANVLAMAPASGDPVGLGFPIVGTWVGPNPNAATDWPFDSGYAAESNFSQPQQDSVSAVSASWVVPKVTGPPTGLLGITVYVGMSGIDDAAGTITLEQIGTQEDFTNGKAAYYAWWFIDNGQEPQVITTMTVNPGDLISAYVVWLPIPYPSGGFVLTIVDKSRANDSFSTYQSTPAFLEPVVEREAAQWFVEAPVDPAATSVPNFGSVFFSDATATINGVTGAINDPSWQSQAMNIVQQGVTYDTTSALNNLGSSFAVTYSTPGGAGGAARAGPSAAAGEPFGTTAGAFGPLAKKVGGPVLMESATLGGGYATSGTLNIARYRPGGRVADKQRATPSNLPLSWLDFDALYDGDTRLDGCISSKSTRKPVSLGFDVET
jgi:hypothetical protein